MKLTPRNTICYLAEEHGGDFDEMLRALHSRQMDKEKYESMPEPIGVVTIMDDEYPENLKRIIKPSLILYTEGRPGLLSDSRRKISVISTDKTNGQELIDIIGGLGDVILVTGIGNSMLEELLNTGKDVIVVAGCGADAIKCCHRNSRLYERIVTDHLLVTEYPKGIERSSKGTIGMQRIVAGIGDLVLVSALESHSVSMLAVSHALEVGKDIYVMPVSGANRLGNNGLIKDGAFLIDNPSDIKTEADDGK